RGPQPAAPDQRRTDRSAGPAGDRRDGADGALPPSRSVPPGRRRKGSMTTPPHADVQTGALPLPVLTVSRWSRVIALLAAIALIGGVACLQFGSERIPLAEVARILLSGGEETLTGVSGVSRSVIVMEVRLPRVLLAFLVGASLAAVGVALQALLRNPLADPYILGVSSGAALGAV